MLYSFLIVNYKTKIKTEKLISDLCSLMKNHHFEIIVVENNSGDTFSFKESYLKLFYMSENLGFGKAMNFAASKASGETLVLINPDCRVDPSQNFHGFVSTNLKEHVGILTSLIRYPDGSIQPNRGSASGFLTYVFQFLRLGRLKNYFPLFLLKLSVIKDSFIGRYLDYNSSIPLSQECEWVSGAFMVIRKENFTRLKGFDPHFFMYCEDEDLCKRAREAGLKILYSSQFTVIHEVGGAQVDTIGQRLKFSELRRLESNLYFLTKHHSKIKANLLSLIYGFGYILMCLKFRNMASYLKIGFSYILMRPA